MDRNTFSYIRVNSSGCYMNSSNPSNPSNFPYSPNTPNTLNKLNTSKASGCSGSYMSWWVTKIEFKELEMGKGVIGGAEQLEQLEHFKQLE